MSLTDKFADLIVGHPEYIKSTKDNAPEAIDRNINTDNYDTILKVTEKDTIPSNYKSGAKSLMNEHAIITIGDAGENYKDEQEMLWLKDDVLPTAKNIIEKWNKENSQYPYKTEDFLYAKYYGLIPNTHLITLRRFPGPIFDNMQVHSYDGETSNTESSVEGKKYVYPIATAVSWFGNETGNDLNKFLNFSVGMNWSEVVADVIKRKRGGAEYKGGNSMLASLFNKVAKVTNAASVTQGGDGYSAKFQGFDYYDGPLKNKVYGPINVINSTKKRERGLTFEQSFEVKFTYNLRAIDSNNPKVAMLDILSNFLTLTYNFAEFWGGAYRYEPGDRSYSPIPGGLAVDKLLMNGDIDGLTAVIKSGANEMVNNVTKTVGEGANALKKFVSGKSSAADLLKGGVKKLAKSGLLQDALIKMGMGDMKELMAVPPLLTGDPVGEWHLTVGNPFNPIVMVGNLICTGMDVEFNNELSWEGFPTEVTFIVKLEHGRPRDAGDIQSMFNKGNGRIYYYDDPEINNSASTKNSNIDNGVNIAAKMGFDTSNGSKNRSK